MGYHLALFFFCITLLWLRVDWPFMAGFSVAFALCLPLIEYQSRVIRRLR